MGSDSDGLLGVALGAGAGRNRAFARRRLAFERFDCARLLGRMVGQFGAFGGEALSALGGVGEAFMGAQGTAAPLDRLAARGGVALAIGSGLARARSGGGTGLGDRFATARGKLARRSHLRFECLGNGQRGGGGLGAGEGLGSGERQWIEVTRTVAKLFALPLEPIKRRLRQIHGAGRVTCGAFGGRSAPPCLIGCAAQGIDRGRSRVATNKRGFSRGIERR